MTCLRPAALLLAATLAVACTGRIGLQDDIPSDSDVGMDDETDDTVDTEAPPEVDTEVDSPADSEVTVEDADDDGAPTGFDCDDGDPEVHPGATERCGGVDEDCDGLYGEDDPDLDLGSATTLFVDSDGDGSGDAATAITGCLDEHPVLVDVGDDCDDNDDSRAPTLPEVCNFQDDDCDDLVDGADPGIDPSLVTTYWPDADHDGYGGDGQEVRSCLPVAGMIVVGGDCDDRNAGISPAAGEVCSGIDEDCDDLVDDDDPDVVVQPDWHLDGDGDGYPGTGVATTCDEAVPPHVAPDCDDGDAAIHPDAPDPRCDGLDASCTGLEEVWVPDDAPSVQAAVDLPGAGSVCVRPGTWTTRVVIEPADGDVEIVGTGADPGEVVLVAPDGSTDMIDQSGVARSADLMLANLTLSAPALAAGTDRRVVVRASADRLQVEDVVVDGVGCDGEPCVPWVLWLEGAVVLVRGVEVRNVEGTEGVLVITNSYDRAEIDDVLVEDVALAPPDGLATLPNEGGFTGISVYALDGQCRAADLRLRHGAFGGRGGQLLAVNSCDLDGALIEDVDILARNGGDPSHPSGANLPARLDGTALALTEGDFAHVAVRGLSVTSAYPVDKDAWNQMNSLVRLRGRASLSNFVVAGIDVGGDFGSGAAVFSVEGTAIQVSNGTIADATVDAGGFFLPLVRAQAVSFRNLIVVDQLDETGAPLTLWESSHASDPPHVGWCVASSPAVLPLGVVDDGGNLLGLLPDFVAYTRGGDPSAWDLRLSPGSPLEDVGAPTLLDPDGTRSAPGAYGGPGGDW